MFQIEKKPFFEYKNKIFQSPQNRIFPKWLTHAFGKKKGQFFPYLDLVKMRLEKMLIDFVEKEETFFDYKNKKF